MRAVLVMLDRGVVRHRFLLFVGRRLDAVSDGKTQTGPPHYRHSRRAQRHSLESCAVTMPAREMRFASLSWGQSSMKRGRTWPARARTVRTADGMKGRLMDGSIGSGRSVEQRKRTPASRITPRVSDRGRVDAAILASNGRSGSRAGEYPRNGGRQALLDGGGREPVDARLSRPRVGGAAPWRSRAVREARPRRVPGGTVVVHHPEQESAVSRGVRGVRSPADGAL